MGSERGTLERDLARLVGAENVLGSPPASSPYNRDAAGRRGAEGRADGVVLPGTPAEVAAVVAWCYEHDVPVVPRGGGTGMMAGAVAVEGGLLLSLERLTRVRELEPALWRILPEAGVRTRDVHRLARENGLMFAPDPGASEQSQIGGNIATNAGGPHALKYGVTGTWVSGLEVVLAPGELVDLGGWSRKDVSGYDLRSLMIGSEGTLGVITAARLRLLPAPEATIPLVVLLASPEEGSAAILDILAAGCRPSVLDFLDGSTMRIVAPGYPGEEVRERVGEAEFMLIAEVDGSPREAEEERDALIDALAGRALLVEEPADHDALWRWRDGVNGVVTGARGAKVSEDVVFPVERLCEGLVRFAEIAAGHGLPSCAWGHGGEGNIHATVMVDPRSEADLVAAEAVGGELFALVVELGGSIAGEHGVGWCKRGRLASQWDAAALDLHEQIKRVFDPKNLLNPGKKLAR